MLAKSSNSKPALDRTGQSMAVELCLLRGFELTCAGKFVHVSSSGQRVLAFLALHPRPLPRSYVAEVLWVESTGERAGANLRSTLWRLKKPGLRLIDRAGDCLHLAEHVIVDVHETEARARRVLDPDYFGDERDAVELTNSGELLPAWYEDWVLIERERQRQLLLHALESLCERFTRRRSFGPAIAAGIAAVQGEPLRETAHRALIQAYVAEGNLGEAIRQYHTCKRLLQEQLGLEPSTDLTESVRKLFQRQAPIQEWAEPPRHSGVRQPDLSSARLPAAFRPRHGCFVPVSDAPVTTKS